MKSFLFACEEGNVSIIDVFLAHEGFNVNAQNEVRTGSNSLIPTMEMTMRLLLRFLNPSCYFPVIYLFLFRNLNAYRTESPG